MTKDPATIFVVDDEESVRHALTEMLEVFGYNVEAHETAEGLLQSLESPDAGCIVADVRMPGGDRPRADLAEVRRIEDVVLLRYALSARFEQDDQGGTTR